MKIRKILAVMLATTMVVSMPAIAAGWQYDSSGSGAGVWHGTNTSCTATNWRWQNDDGSYLSSQWVWLDGNGDGISECYYLDSTGNMCADGTWNGYEINSDGAWVVGGVVQTQGSAAGSIGGNAGNRTIYAGSGYWVSYNIGWWWQNYSGTYPINSWNWLDGNGDGISECYYFNADGYMLSNTTTPDGYTVNSDGAWIYGGSVQTRGSSNIGTNQSYNTGGSSSSGGGSSFNNDWWWYGDSGDSTGSQDESESLDSYPGLKLNSNQSWRAARIFGRNDYSVAQPKTGYSEGYYTLVSDDGTFSSLVVSSSADTIYVETYDDTGRVTSTKSISFELPEFVAFLDGREYNYLAFGQMNSDHDDNAEVWRIVQYDKDWNRLGAVSANGRQTYTSEPARSTVSRMAESTDGSELVLYSARTRYDAHQSNITFIMDAEPFEMDEIMGEEFPSNHVSHSFGQFVQYDGDEWVTVDHGDAYPRSFVLQNADGQETTLMEIYGETGDNTTNAIGSGFEVSQDGYLFLGCSNPQNGNSSAPWNVFLTFTRGSNGRLSSNTTLKWLTHSGSTIDCARLVKINADKFVAMWAQGDDIHYQVLDGSGNLTGSEHVASGYTMPPTDPVVYNGDVYWIQAASDNTPVLFSLSID